MGLLVRPRAGALGGVGSGRPGARRRRRGSWLEHTQRPAPLGLSLHSMALFPGGKAEELGQLAEASGTRTCFSSLCHPSPVSTKLAKRAQRVSQAVGWGGGHRPTAQRGQDSREAGHVQSVGTIRSELKVVSAPFFGFLAQTEASQDSGCHEGSGGWAAWADSELVGERGVGTGRWCCLTCTHIEVCTHSTFLHLQAVFWTEGLPGSIMPDRPAGSFRPGKGEVKRQGPTFRRGGTGFSTKEPSCPRPFCPPPHLSLRTWPEAEPTSSSSDAESSSGTFV